MFKWAMMLLALGVATGCMGAMGVGAVVMIWLLGAFFLMGGIAFLIAWPFLRRGRSDEQKITQQEETEKTEKLERAKL